MSPPPNKNNTLINTKYKCQEKEEVELENSM